MIKTALKNKTYCNKCLKNNQIIEISIFEILNFMFKYYK